MATNKLRPIHPGEIISEEYLAPPVREPARPGDSVARAGAAHQ